MVERSGRGAALAGFVREVYAPGLHGAFAAAWFLALDGACALLAGRRWSLRYSAVGVVAFFLVLFYLRVLDEWKDLDYDRVHNPGRPLVRGTVRLVDLYWFLLASALGVVALHVWIPQFSGGSVLPLTILIVDLLYGLALVTLERIAPRVKERMFLNLALTYPVNVALSIYAYAAYHARTGEALSLRSMLLVFAFALAFLHYEVARKTSWRRDAAPGKRLYSTVIGETASVSLAVLCGAGAIAIVVALLAPVTWLGVAPVLALVPVVAGVRRFRAQPTGGGRTRSATPMASFGMLFLTIFYATILVANLTAGLSL